MPVTRIRNHDLLSGSVASGTLGAGSITGQIAATTVQDADLVLIFDNDASALRKMTRANFTAGLSTTLSGAYDAGRVITASNGPVDIQRTSNTNAATELLRLAVSGSVTGFNAGPRLSFHVPFADESRVGAAIDGIKNQTSENDSTSELRFSTSDNNETLDHQVTISSDGLAVAGRGESVPFLGSAASAFHVATSGITNALVVKNSNGYVGLGDTSPEYNLQITSAGDAAIFLEADTDNSGEGDNAFIKFSQDNTIVQAIIGLVGFDNRDPEGVTYTGALANNFLLGNTTNYGLQLGTNDNVRMSIANTGEITKDAQPAFNAYRNTDQSNIADNGTIIFDAERFDVGSNYNTSTGFFTAPVTGKYLLTYSVDVKALDTDASYYWLQLVTSNRNYYGPFVPVGQLLSSDGRMTFQNTVVADMDASDTAYLRLDRDGGVTQADIVGASSSSYTWFHGYLLG